MKEWLKHWDETKRLTREEAIKILNLPKEDMDDLIACAYALRSCLLYTSDAADEL